MQGAGNDFVIIDNRHTRYSTIDLRKWCPLLCDRRFGVGADGLISIEADDEDPKSDFQMLYLNADGSDAGMCGNGGRCIARFANHLGLGAKLTFRVHDEYYQATVGEDNRVELLFPMSVNQPDLFSVNSEEVYSLRPGTEHAVCLVDEEELKSRISLTPRAKNIRGNKEHFPAGTNVNFISSKFENFAAELQIETYERGVEDFTYACGTGAIASAITAHHNSKYLQPDVKHPGRWRVNCAGGELEVSFSYDAERKTYSNISLKGPAEFVFSGEITL